MKISANNKIPGGNQMSLSKSRIGRRLALLTGAALIAQSGAALAADQTTNVNSAGSVVANAAAGDTHTVNIAVVVGEHENGFADFNNLVLSGSGGGNVIINNNGRIGGRTNFSGLTGGLEINLNPNSRWRFTQTSTMSAGGDTLTIDEGAVMIVGRPAQNGPSFRTNVVDFIGGDDTFVNAGTLLMMPSQSPAGRQGDPGELRFENLETFVHSGVIYMGGPGNVSGFGDVEEVVDETERWNDDILLMPGAHFVGEDGLIVMDVNYNGLAQAGCSATFRLASGDLPGADCLGLVGGSTEGTTYLELTDVLPGDRGGYNPEGFVLVDVSGGDSAAGHFVLSEESEGYSSLNGGIIDKGAFFYGLAYSPDTQQHILVGLPGQNMMQLTLLSQAAHDLWRLSTGSWLDRQADLRDAETESAGGVWLRAAGEGVDRDAIQSVDAFGTTYSFDNTLSQTSYTVTIGADIITAATESTSFVVGVMAGYAHSDVEYEASPNAARFDGFTAGAYASLVSGGLFIDAAVNVNKLVMDDDVPALDLFPAGTILSTNLMSVGGQVEAGWRFGFDGFFVEPLAGVSWVKTTYDDFAIPPDDAGRIDQTGVGISYDDPNSLRAGVGARVGMDQDYGGMQAQYSLLARVWNEFEGESRATLTSIGPDAFVTDQFDGQVTEVGVGASLYGGGVVSGFVNLGGKFGDDYGAKTASAGLRVAF